MATEIILKGRVQGVCCRMYCQQVARTLGLQGAVTNLFNGNVQVLLVTENSEQVKGFVEALVKNRFGFSFFGRISDAAVCSYQGVINGDYVWQ